LTESIGHPKEKTRTEIEEEKKLIREAILEREHQRKEIQKNLQVLNKQTTKQTNKQPNKHVHTRTRTNTHKQELHKKNSIFIFSHLSLILS
jgi:hypothetical protein